MRGPTVIEEHESKRFVRVDINTALCAKRVQRSVTQHASGGLV